MNTSAEPRAPAVQAKLDAAIEVLEGLESDVAALALEASEGKAGAEKALASHRSKIELAARNVSELRRARALAGLTRESCADACSERGCALAEGRPFCFHPLKGGVPQLLKNDPAIQKLEAEAREALGLRTPVLKGAA